MVIVKELNEYFGTDIETVGEFEEVLRGKFDSDDCLEKLIDFLNYLDEKRE